jgi:hypothetical protein
MNIRPLLLLVALLAASSLHAGMLDDFEGGVDWGQAPWLADVPLFNRDGAEVVTQTMNPEWKFHGSDQTAGPDFGFIEHDRTVGHASSSSLKYTVTGGNTSLNQANKVVSGDGLRGSFYITSLPAVGQTFTVAGVTFTFQSGARTGAGQVQIGANIADCATNMAAAINADVAVAKVHAVADPATGSPTWVGVSYCGDAWNCATGVSVTEAASGIGWVVGVASRDNYEAIYTSHPDLIGNLAGAGGWYLYFGSSGGKMFTGLHDRFVVPAAKRPAGSNRLTFWALNPYEGNNTTSVQNVSLGTRTNSQARFDAVTHFGIHYYHNIKLARSNYWQKVTITNNPDHKVNATGDPPIQYVPDNPTTAPQWNGTEGWDGYTWNYMEGLQHFYIEQSEKSATPPWSIWFDDIEIWQDTISNAPEYVATHTVAYLGSNQVLLNWTGRYATTDGTGYIAAPSGDGYRIYYSTTPMTGANFSSVGILAPGTFTRVADQKLVQATITVPSFDENTTYYFAISPTNEPTTAGIVEYMSGPAFDADPDTTAPMILNPSPSGAQSCTSDPRSVAIGVSTSEDATCKWGLSDDTFANLFNTFTVTGGVEHTALLTGLSCGSAYTRYVRCQDAAQNESTTTPISFSIAGQAGAARVTGSLTGSIH